LAPVRGFLHVRLGTFVFLKFVVQDKKNAFVSSTIKQPPCFTAAANLYSARIAPNHCYMQLHSHFFQPSIILSANVELSMSAGRIMSESLIP
jgi:hypothetical protein